MGFVPSMFSGHRKDESMRDYVTRLAGRGSLGPVFLPAAFRGLLDVYRLADDLNARVVVLEAEVARLRAALHDA